MCSTVKSASLNFQFRDFKVLKFSPSLSHHLTKLQSHRMQVCLCLTYLDLASSPGPFPAFQCFTLSTFKGISNITVHCGPSFVRQWCKNSHPERGRRERERCVCVCVCWGGGRGSISRHDLYKFANNDC